MTDTNATPYQTTGPNTFPARARAAAIAADLMDRFVTPTELAEPTRETHLGDAFLEIPSTDKRAFTFGHWTFQFAVNLQDTRGKPPVVWLFLEIYQKGKPDCDPVSLAAFYDFNEFDCTTTVYKPLQRDNETSVIAYNGFDYDELSTSAAGYIRQYLEADPPAISRLSGSFLRHLLPADLHPRRRPSHQS